MYILGGCQTDFAKRWSSPDRALFEMLSQSVLGALEDAKLEPEAVQVAHIGNFVGELFCGQGHLGGLFASAHPAFAGACASRHEAACASGSMAALAALSDLAAGHYEVACIVGLEQMRNVPGQTAAEHLGAALWAGREATEARYVWPAQFSRITEAYDARYGVKREHLAAIAQKNYDHAKRNPKAQTRGWSFERSDFLDSSPNNPVIEGMVRKQDCARITDGAAAIIAVSPSFAQRWAAKRGLDIETIPRVSGWGHRTAPMLLEDKLEATSSGLMFPHVARAIQDAQKRAQLPSTRSLDLVETHDCFTITEYMAIDHFGLTDPGQAWQAIESGLVNRSGALPFNPSGGLIGAGHPVGATGVRMLLDAAKQVSGSAGDCQVEGARRAQTLNIGGSTTTVASFVVER